MANGIPESPLGEAARASVAPAPQAPAATAAGSLPTVEGDGLPPIYANFVKVTPAPEELVLDFGLNPNLPGAPQTPIRLSQRLVLNYYTVKRLWGALGLALQRHEQTFGSVEVDVNKRVVPRQPR